jgi:hypothetical protein
MTLGYLSTQASHTTQVTRKRQVVGKETSSNDTINDRINSLCWILLYFGISGMLSFTFLGVTASSYKPRYAFILPSLLGIAFLISCLSWLQTMMSMNLLKKCTTARSIALILYILASVCFFASSLAVMQQIWVLQFLCSLSGSIIGWLAFITIFKGEFLYPSRQQFGALAQILALSFLWECRTFIVNMHFQ